MTVAAEKAGFIAPAQLKSPGHGVSLFWCTLSARADTIADVIDWLSADERARLQRFGNETLRNRYVMGRASLRWLLAQALGASPAGVAIERGANGRPRIAGGTGIDFNVSHTADVALIGIVRKARIGVDVEREDRVIHSKGLTRRILTEPERAALPSDDDDAIRRRILRLWTCKEALAKATGDAMAAPFRRLDVTIEPMLALADGPPPYRARDFRLFAAAVADGYLGTVALWRPRNGGDDFNGHPTRG
jgi:4'-phosphopantetheinyl transferase